METMMEINLATLDFSPASKVWIYTANKTFNVEEELSIRKELDEFCSHWDSHSSLLAAKNFILFSQIIILVVDDSFNPISGCALDKSVAFLKKLEINYNVSLFDRWLQTANIHDQWITYPTFRWSEKFSAKEINFDTLFLDTMVNNLFDAKHHLIKKLGDFWLKRFI
jgi:hypothetical protein